MDVTTMPSNFEVVTWDLGSTRNTTWSELSVPSSTQTIEHGGYSKLGNAFPRGQTLTSSDILESYVKAIYSILIGVLALLGNGMVLAITWRDRHNIRQRSTRLFLASLAASDLLAVLLANIPRISENIAGTWLLGLVICKSYGLFRSMAANVSILTLCFISIDRYLAVSKPNQMHATAKYAGVIVAVIWVYNIAVHLPFLWWNDVITIGRTRKLCTISPIRIYTSYYTLILRIVNFFFPLVITWVAYLAIIHHMWLSKTRVAALNSNMSASKQKGLLKVVKMCLLIVCLFTVMWTPFQISLVSRFFNNDSRASRKVMGFLYLLAEAGHVINPVVYTFMYPAFRSSLIKWIPCFSRLLCITPAAPGSGNQEVTGTHTAPPPASSSMLNASNHTQVARVNITPSE